MCLVGDATHAKSPHHAAGAGFCIEGAAVLTCLLSGETTTSATTAEIALRVFGDARRERGAWLVQSSRQIGTMYERLVLGIEFDYIKIEEEI